MILKKDKYKNFSELQLHNLVGIDYKIEFAERSLKYIVIAIHGGNIEKGTTEIAKAISGGDLSFYSFIGIKNNNEDLHVTSSKFDEGKCLDLLSKVEKVISIHGMSGDDEFVMIGGLDNHLIYKVSIEMDKLGIENKIPSENLNGNLPNNICNKGRSASGLQIEMSKGFRDKIMSNPIILDQFAKAIRRALSSERT